MTQNEQNDTKWQKWHKSVKMITTNKNDTKWQNIWPETYVFLKRLQKGSKCQNGPNCPKMTLFEQFWTKWQKQMGLIRDFFQDWTKCQNDKISKWLHQPFPNGPNGPKMTKRVKKDKTEQDWPKSLIKPI